MFTKPTNAVTTDYPQQLGRLIDLAEGPALRNFIRNGDFMIAQRGTSFAGISGGVYTLDGIYAPSDPSGTSTFSQQPFTVGQTSVPGNPRNFLRIDRTGAAAAANSVVRFPIEMPDRLAGRTVTFSFWAKIASGTKTFTADAVFTGTTPGAYFSMGSFVASTSWQLFKFSTTIEAITAVTSSAGFWPRIAELSGFGTFTLDIADVQLELGSEATAFERLGYADQLRWAQRFLPAIAATGTGHPVATGMNFSTTQSIVQVPFKVRARAAITGASVSSAGHASIAKADSTLAVCTALAFNRGGDEVCELLSTVASGLAQGNATALYLTNAAGSIVFTGAEL